MAAIFRNNHSYHGYISLHVAGHLQQKARAPREHSQGCGAGGGGCSGPRGCCCAGSPRAEQGTFPCLPWRRREGEGGGGPQTRGFAEPQPGRGSWRRRTNEPEPGVGWSRPVVPRLRPVLGQGSGEGNPSPPLHRQGHCIPQHFCPGGMY